MKIDGKSRPVERWKTLTAGEYEYTVGWNDEEKKDGCYFRLARCVCAYRRNRCGLLRFAFCGFECVGSKKYDYTTQEIRNLKKLDKDSCGVYIKSIIGENGLNRL